ncbi:hypothetical protein [Methylobacterium frigidaeris]|uniref:Uncharacterized protein n=1 Tax=Methylobacterium frigidaeris TaxID=2038277 RepID=A0AA37H5U4_9HYPH|nr:hypothetical protein [Methylobacterium frigidaeris]PIK71479.1 hypothetical protein CS379_19100 [Methylobacterium frigidaeris]GJD60089.1 hypothetical protein MPEAHAMD_0224 [Methylobacterium frigidaeris]
MTLGASHSTRPRAHRGTAHSKTRFAPDQARTMAPALHSPLSSSGLSQAARAEIQALRLAAGILDLQRTASPEIRDLPSVQAMIRAATAVFDELGFGEDCEADRTDVVLTGAASRLLLPG